jgi:GNAT superfamily N-acetyltransferase
LEKSGPPASAHWRWQPGLEGLLARAISGFMIASIGLQFAFPAVEYRISQYELEQGALEIQYIEEFFGEFPRKKTAPEIIRRLQGRAHLILLAMAPLPDDPGSVVPVAFKVAHEIKVPEVEPKLVDLMHRLHGYVHFDGRRILYTWIGGTRRDWRGQGFFRALTEQQEAWAIEQGFDEIVVKTKNKFYDMRGTLDHLRFEVVKYERNASDNAESKVYLSKKLVPETISTHRSAKTVVQMPV